MPILVFFLVSPPGGCDLLVLAFQPPYLHAVHGPRASGHEVSELNRFPFSTSARIFAPWNADVCFMLSASIMPILTLILCRFSIGPQ